MVIRYTTVDPTGNITLLVTTAVERSLQPQTAAWLLRRHPGAEQVGFLEPSSTAPARLQMMGGEFCANATMSLGAWLCRRDGLAKGVTHPLRLEISGAEALVPCEVTAVADSYLCTVSLPLPEKMVALKLPTEDGPLSLPAVFLPGICHIIAPAGCMDRARAESLLRQWSAAIHAEAVGLIFLDEERTAIEPLVYVKSTDTAVWERCCGSGSAAVACYLTEKRQAAQTVSIRQQGGTIAAVTAREQALTSLHITGSVRILGEQTVDVIF